MTRKSKAKSDMGKGMPPGFNCLWNPEKTVKENLADAHYFARFSPDRTARKIIWPTEYTPEIQATIDQKKAAAKARIEELKAHPTEMMVLKQKAAEQKKAIKKKIEDTPSSKLRGASLLEIAGGQPKKDELTDNGHEAYALMVRTFKGKQFQYKELRKAAGKPVGHVVEKLLKLGYIKAIKL